MTRPVVRTQSQTARPPTPLGLRAKNGKGLQREFNPETQRYDGPVVRRG